MKKPKMPIRRKLLILTAALSAALALSAFFVSYRMFTEKSEEDAVARCKAAAEGADEAINAEYEGFVSVCVQKMGAVYYENRDLLESVADPERSFASYEERESSTKTLPRRFSLRKALSGFPTKLLYSHRTTNGSCAIWSF